MTRWQLETSAQFDKATRKLDRQMLRRIKVYLDEVCDLEDPRSRGKGLAGNLAGYWRYRVGDYRVVAEIHDNTLVVVAIGLGHRSDFYELDRTSLGSNPTVTAIETPGQPT